MSWNPNDNDPWGRKNSPPDPDDAIKQLRKMFASGGSGGDSGGTSFKFDFKLEFGRLNSQEKNEIVLADEINRAPAKVQSALLEAMQEKQVTIGDKTFKLTDPFLKL